MTIAAYSTDLADIIDFEGTPTIDTEVVGYTATAKPTNSTDFPIQGLKHADAEQRATGNGSLVADNGSGVTWTSGDYVFMWGVFTAPGAINTFAGAGMALYIGADTSNGYKWTVGGRDFGRYPYGGWQNFVVDPELTTGRTNVGSGAGTTYRWFGMLCNVTSVVAKSSPYGIDVVRYGRGEIITINGDATAYGTFEDMAAENDYNDATNGYHSWGLFSYQGGSYIWKGLMTLGNATVVDFRDSNRNIVIENSINVNSSFNRIEINNASSNVEWTHINISSLCTVSKGQFEMIDDATVDMDTCVFADMSTFIFQSNATLLACTFQRCDLVTQGGGTFTSCTFDESVATKALAVDTVALVTKCHFISDGTGYAMEGFSAAGDYNLTTITYSGYASSNGTTGNECIHVLASSGIVNINVLSSGDLPTYHTAGATVNVINAVTVNIYVKDGSNNAVEGASVSVYQTSDDTELMNELSAVTTGLATESINYSADIPVYIRVRKSTTGTRYYPVNTSGTILSTGLTTTIVLNIDNIVT